VVLFNKKVFYVLHVERTWFCLTKKCFTFSRCFVLRFHVERRFDAFSRGFVKRFHFLFYVFTWFCKTFSLFVLRFHVVLFNKIT